MVFAAVCILPTTSLLAYALWLKTPLHRHHQADGFSRQTGTSISLGELTYPAPGVTRLRNVTLTHAQTGEELAQIRELEIQRDGNCLVIHAAQPQLAATNMDELWRQLQQQLLEDSFPACDSIQLIASDVTVTAVGSSQSYSLVEANYSSSTDQRTLNVLYKLAGNDAQEPATLTFNRQGVSTSRIEWNTGDAELPIAPWTKQFPWLKSLGSDCCFCGVLVSEQSAGESSGSITGTLSNIDLDRFISDSFAHKLSGRANVEIHNARFTADRLTELHASIQAGPGVIGKKLLRKTQSEWNLDSSADLSKSKPLLKYKQLACDLRITNGRLHVSGTCHASNHATLIVLDDASWRTPSNTNYDPATIIRILSAADSANIPATESTRHLIRWLPLASENTDATGAAPQAHLRGSATPQP